MAVGALDDFNDGFHFEEGKCISGKLSWVWNDLVSTPGGTELHSLRRLDGNGGSVVLQSG